MNLWRRFTKISADTARVAPEPELLAPHGEATPLLAEPTASSQASSSNAAAARERTGITPSATPRLGTASLERATLKGRWRNTRQSVRRRLGRAVNALPLKAPAAAPIGSRGMQRRETLNWTLGILRQPSLTDLGKHFRSGVSRSLSKGRGGMFRGVSRKSLSEGEGEEDEFLEADQLPEEQRIRLQHVFDKFDNEREGSIDKKDLAQVLRLVGSNPSNAEIGDLVKALQLSESKRITFVEVINVWWRHEKRKMDDDFESELKLAFDMFDSDGSGSISLQELRDKLMTTGEPMSDEEVAQLLSECDSDGSGSLSWGEFRSLNCWRS